MIRMAWALELNEQILEELYVWIDSIPLSKSKKRIERDFSDGKILNDMFESFLFCSMIFKGTLVAEVVRYYLPDLIETHNYTGTSSINQKKINWGILNKKVFNRIGFDLPESMINDLCLAKTGKIEIFLFNLKLKIDEELELRQKIEPQGPSSSSPRQSSSSLNLAMDSKEMSSPKKSGSKTSRTSRSIDNRIHRWVPRLDYEELKQKSLQQQEDIEIFQAKIRRLEHVLQLKDIKINELTSLFSDYKCSKKSNYLFNQRNKKN